MELCKLLIDMKKAALILPLLSLYFVPVFAQDEVAQPETQKREMAAPPKTQKDKDPNAPSFRDRVFFGGNFWLQFWGSYRYIELSPLVGYAITPKLLGGRQIASKDAAMTNAFHGSDRP